MEISWQGPIPPPQMLRKSNEIIPNGAERLIAQFESETKHRHMRERRAQNYPLIDQLAARICALVFALACLGVAVHAINVGYPWVAAAFGVATIAIGVSAFLGQATKTERSPIGKRNQPDKRR